MDITTSKPTQAEAAALVHEFVAKSFYEWSEGEDLYFLAKQLEGALFSTSRSIAPEFAEAASQYRALQDLDDLSNEEVAETVDAARYRPGQRDLLRDRIEDCLNAAVNDILTGSGYGSTTKVAA